MPAVIPAHNSATNAKHRAWRQRRAEHYRISRLAISYRDGHLSAETIPPSDREAVMRYLQTHPRRHA